MTGRCTVTPNCARIPYHRGAHTPQPAPYTLAALDFPTPPWADLNDEDAA